MPEDTGGQATTPEEGSLDLDSALAEAIGEGESSPGAEEPNTEVEDVEPEAQPEGGTEGAGQSVEEFEWTTKKGDTFKATREELQNGYMRQADYTRAKQELAAKQSALEAYEQLEAAFQDDPLGTLNRIADSLNIEQRFGQQSDNQADSGLDPDDPIAQELRGFKEWQQSVNADMAARRQAESLAAVDRELEAVKVKFNTPDLDEDALLQFAADNRIPSLEIAYQAMNFGAAPPPKKVAAKQALPPVEGGRNRNVGVAPKKDDSPSWEDAFNEAWSEVN